MKKPTELGRSLSVYLGYSDACRLNPAHGYGAEEDAALRTLNAADDMLAACKVALAYLYKHVPKGNIRESSHFAALNEHANSVCKPLHAAIAKAEGGAS